MKRDTRTGGREGLYNNLRCRICNKVSHAEISGDYGDHSEAAFYEEPDGLGFLCHECQVEYTSVLDDFSVDDEFDYPDEEMWVDTRDYDD